MNLYEQLNTKEDDTTDMIQLTTWYNWVYDTTDYMIQMSTL